MAGVDVGVVEILTIGGGSAASLSIVTMPEMADGTGAGRVADRGTIGSGGAESGNGTGTTTSASKIADAIVIAISTVTASGQPANEGSLVTAISCVTTFGEIVSKE
jgi:hypothetical protein